MSISNKAFKGAVNENLRQALATDCYDTANHRWWSIAGIQDVALAAGESTLFEYATDAMDKVAAHIKTLPIVCRGKAA